MKFARIISQLFASLCILLLPSCFESHEEVWLNADASGAARFKLSLPLTPLKLQGGEEGVRKKITEYMDGTDVFSSYELNTKVAEDRLYIDLYVTFDNVMNLRKLSSEETQKDMPSSSSALMGKTEVSLKGLNVSYIRNTNISEAIPGTKYLSKKSTKDFKLTTILHLPKAPISHNATSTENDGKTLIWITPLAKAISGPQQTVFLMPLPIPWGIVTVVILIIAGLIYYLWRRKKAKKQIALNLMQDASL